MSFRRRIRRSLQVVLLASSITLPTFANPVSDEDVKLALVYKIARFVTWPESEADADRPFRLCVAEKKLHKRATDRLTGRKIRDRDIQVNLLRDIAREFESRCDVLYMVGVKKERFVSVLDASKGTPVLTVSDTPEFVNSGGMIGLSKRSNKISMKINVAAYESSGLVISSQLLELADLVNDNRKARR
ncbi:MAG: YfiR family protein [Woeseiaceae bacterium]|nr:YfiR family protein [Woeseiaceae bacterium]